MSISPTVGIAYIPVLHKGYFEFIRELEMRGAEVLYLIGDDILESHESLDYIHRKDRLRAVPVESMIEALAPLTKLSVVVLDADAVRLLAESKATIITPREDIGRYIVDTYFGGHQINYIDIFLRRHTGNIGTDKEPESETIELSDFQKNVVARMVVESTKSADWWRHVGAVLIKDGEVISIAHNEHMPEAQLPNIIGDSRALFHKGDHINYVTSAHAEVGVIADAARSGVSTEGSELFVTDFPCPYCARLVAKSGIKKVYFMRGYAVLDGDDFFEEMGIEVVRIQEKKASQ